MLSIEVKMVFTENMVPPPDLFVLTIHLYKSLVSEREKKTLILKAEN